jgi:hypothetical protein
MANGWGGKRPGAGPKKGAKYHFTQEAIRKAASAPDAIMPLEFMLAVIRNEDEDFDRRMDAAKAAAPYIHAKLAQMEHKGSVSIEVFERIIRARDRTIDEPES